MLLRRAVFESTSSLIDSGLFLVLPREVRALFFSLEETDARPKGPSFISCVRLFCFETKVPLQLSPPSPLFMGTTKKAF